MSADCLDCALDQCDLCADGYGDGFGCCCGHVRSVEDDFEDDA